MLLLAAIAVPPEPVHRPDIRAAVTVTVRIERPVELRAGDWDKLPAEIRRDVVRIGPDGRPVRLRLVEMP